jgi:hypothetical protein
MVFVQDTHNFYHCEEIVSNNTVSSLCFCLERSHHHAFGNKFSCGPGFRDTSSFCFCGFHKEDKKFHAGFADQRADFADKY